MFNNMFLTYKLTFRNIKRAYFTFVCILGLKIIVSQVEEGRTFWQVLAIKKEYPL